MAICVTNEELIGLNVYIRPTYTVVMPAKRGKRGPLTEIQKLNMQHLRAEKHTGEMSSKARKRLTNCVNWLVASAKKKRVYCKETNKNYTFKVNFVTLTLPTLEHDLSDNNFKKRLLHSFINACRYRYNLQNYIWKVEAQDNGNIHAHFTTDCFLPWRGIRDIWNAILEKHGLIDPYREKHMSMSLEDYIRAYNNDGKRSINSLRIAYNYGQRTNWSDPNTTDVHAVYKVKDIAAYMSKYMAKNEANKRKIKGSLWRASYNITRANKLSMELPYDAGMESLNSFMQPDIEFSEIIQESKDGLTSRKVGEIFFTKLSDWFDKISGPIAEVYKNTLHCIRHGIDIDAFSSPPEEHPEPIINNVIHVESFRQLDFFQGAT